MSGDLNGRAGRAAKRVKAKAVRPARAGADPLARVLSTSGRVPVSVTVAAAVFLHVGMAAGATAAAHFGELFAWERAIRDVIEYRLSQYEVDLIKETPPPPPPPEEEPKPEPEPAKPPPKDEAPPPPPTPAQAGRVLTADPDPNEPVDLTGGFVQGNAATYAGGITSSNGTGTRPVYNPAAAPTGVPGGTGTAPAPAARKEDRSRVPGLLGSVDWNDCPFPGEADAEQIDQAFVLIQVKVKPDGSPDNVSVLQDPGHGFGREARKCAMRKKYSSGLDPDGNAIPGTTKPFRVRFER
jgi:periplasmic protein TonB